jgi:hypothetical protein
MGKYRVALVLLTLLIVLFAALHVEAMFTMFTGGIGLDVDKLEGKPEKYIVVTEDPLLSKAVEQLSKDVNFNSLGETQLDDLIAQYGTNNIQYRGSYYSIRMVNWDGVTQLGSALWTISLIGLVVTPAMLVCLVVCRVGWEHAKKTLQQLKKIILRIPFSVYGFE